MDDKDAVYIIRTEDGTGTEMTHDEVVRWVGVAISYRLEKTLCRTVEGRVINEAAEAAVNWLSASLPRTDDKGAG